MHPSPSPPFQGFADATTGDALDLGVFPVHYRYLSSIGLHMYLDDLRSLSQKKVTNLELIKIRIALTVLSKHPRT